MQLPSAQSLNARNACELALARRDSTCGNLTSQNAAMVSRFTHVSCVLKAAGRSTFAISPAFLYIGRPTTAAPTTAAPTTAAPTTAAPSNAPASQIEGYDNSDLELQEELFGQPRHNDDMIEREDDEGNAIDEDFE